MYEQRLLVLIHTVNSIDRVYGESKGRVDMKRKKTPDLEHGILITQEFSDVGLVEDDDTGWIQLSRIQR
jgi:hypothetical protein